MNLTSPWVLAARPATLPAAFVPVAVAGGLAYADGVFSGAAFLAALGGSLAIQVATNFANDASDAARGADTDERVGPPRAVASGLLTPEQVWRGVWAMFGLAALCGVYLALRAGPLVLVIGVAAIVAGLGYTGGPRPYGYAGLGEVFVFVFFGLVATVGSRYVHDSTAPGDAWILAVPVGLLAAAILVANNIRDIDTDERAGKRTLAVMMGRARTERLYAWLLWASFLVVSGGVLGAWLNVWTLLAFLALPWAATLVRVVRSGAEGLALIPVLKGTAKLQLLVGALLTVGAVL